MSTVLAVSAGALVNVFTTGWSWTIGISLGVLLVIWVAWEVHQAGRKAVLIGLEEPTGAGPERVRSPGVTVVPSPSGSEDSTLPGFEGSNLRAIQPASNVETTWPIRVGVVPGPADCFQHRVVASELETDMVHNNHFAGTRILSGLGGVGKTQIAAALARRAWSESTVELLVWINAASREAIISGYAQAGAEAGVADPSNADLAAQRFLTWLSKTRRRWLVVLNDLADPGDLVGRWPPVSQHGQVLVTTRRRDATLRGRGRFVEVELFSPPEATAYLQEKLSDPAESLEEVALLAAEIGYLPLALAQAAAYIVDRGIDCAAYRARFADRSHSLAELVPDSGALPDDHQTALAVTWSLSLEAANQLEPVGLARPILLALSLLDSNGIPYEALTSAALRDYCAKLRTHTVKTEMAPITIDDARDALHCLYRFSLATPAKLNGHSSVRIHNLVQRAGRELAIGQHLALAADAAARSLLEVWPEIERDTAYSQILRNNVMALRSHMQASVWSSDARSILFRAGRSLGDCGSVVVAAEYFQALAEEASTRLGPHHLDTLSARAGHARWLGHAGDLAGAVASYEDLLVDCHRVLGPDHPDTLSARGSLARWRSQAGDPVGAMAAAEQLLADYVRVLGPDHPDTLSTRSNLAKWMGQAGNPIGAIAASDALLEDYRRVLGPDHPDALSTRNYRARWLGEAGDPRKALAAASLVVEDYLRVLGPDQPDTLNARGNRARWQGESGDITGAVRAYEGVLTDRTRVLGENHPETLTARNNLAFWRGQTGDASNASAALADLVIDCLRVLGPSHPATLTARTSHAFFLGEAGDRLGAALGFEVLVRDYLRVFGADHPDTLNVRVNSTRWRGLAGDPAGAATEAEEVAADCARVLGPSHPATMSARGNLAFLLGEAGDSAGAAAAYRQLLADRTRVLGPNHPDTVSTRKNLTFWLFEG